METKTFTDQIRRRLSPSPYTGEHDVRGTVLDLVMTRRTRVRRDVLAVTHLDRADGIEPLLAACRAAVRGVVGRIWPPIRLQLVVAGPEREWLVALDRIVPDGPVPRPVHLTAIYLVDPETGRWQAVARSEERSGREVDGSLEDQLAMILAA